MKFFGRKSAGRASARPVLSRAFGTFIAGEWPRSYEGQVRDGYIGNPVAQRAVRLVAEGVASAPLVASDEGAGALIAATSGGQVLMETLAIHLLLHGNGFVHLLCDPAGQVTELFALRPERVSVEADARGWPAAFTYRVGESVLRIPADQMIHIRTHNPLDDHYGLGCLGAASGPIAIHNAATKWNKALLDNAARPSGALVYDPGDASTPLSGEQYDRLKAELLASYAGADNAGRPMLLEGGLSWQAMSLSPADMDFIALKSGAARDIALAFGVPPMLLGLPGDATYANYREANKALWRQTILPLAGKLLAALAEGLKPWFAGLELGIDLDAVTALSEDRERLWAQVNGVDFLTLNEKRALVGLAAVELPAPPTDVPGEAEAAETKFNPWHDADDGRFTSAGSGNNFGGGGASGSWDAPTAKAPRSSATRQADREKPVLRGGGGSFGGAGASGTWDSPVKPKPRPQIENTPSPRPPPKPTRPARKPDTPVRPSPVAFAAAVRPKPTTTRITKNGYDFDIDKSNRTRRASGTLRLNSNQGRSKPAQQAAGKPDRLPTDHGGHYIAREFDGPTDKFNHFAQDAKFNTREYRALERHWGSLTKAGREVKVDIVPHYTGQSQRPSSIDINYRVDGSPFHKYFPNAKKGK